MTIKAQLKAIEKELAKRNKPLPTFQLYINPCYECDGCDKCQDYTKQLPNPNPGTVVINIGGEDD